MGLVKDSGCSGKFLLGGDWLAADDDWLHPRGGGLRAGPGVSSAIGETCNVSGVSASAGEAALSAGSEVGEPRGRCRGVGVVTTVTIVSMFNPRPCCTGSEAVRHNINPRSSTSTRTSTSTQREFGSPFVDAISYQLVKATHWPKDVLDGASCTGSERDAS